MVIQSFAFRRDGKSHINPMPCMRTWAWISIRQEAWAGGKMQTISVQGTPEYGISIARFLRSGNSKREIPSEKISR